MYASIVELCNRGTIGTYLLQLCPSNAIYCPPDRYSNILLVSDFCLELGSIKLYNFVIESLLEDDCLTIMNFSWATRSKSVLDSKNSQMRAIQHHVC